MRLVAQTDPGSYTVINPDTQSEQTVNVPTLTASITPGTYVEGATLTLTTNASPRSRYQWRRNGTDIAGATGSSLATAQGMAGTITARIQSGRQVVVTDPITLTAGVTASITAQTPFSVLLPSDNTTQSLTRPLGFAAPAGTRIILAVTVNRTGGTGNSIASVTIGGQAATKIAERVGQLPMAWFDITLTAAVDANTPVVVSFPNFTTMRELIWQAFIVAGYGAPQSVATNEISGTSGSVSVNPPAGSAVFAARSTGVGSPTADTVTGANSQNYVSSPAVNSTSMQTALAVNQPAQTGLAVTFTGVSANRRIAAFVLPLAA